MLWSAKAFKELKMKLICGNAKRYKGVKPPKCRCKTCAVIYLRKQADELREAATKEYLEYLEKHEKVIAELREVCPHSLRNDITCSICGKIN